MCPRANFSRGGVVLRRSPPLPDGAWKPAATHAASHEDAARSLRANRTAGQPPGEFWHVGARPNLAYTASLSNRQKHRQNPRFGRHRIFFNLLSHAHKPAHKIGKNIGKNAYENGH